MLFQKNVVENLRLSVGWNPDREKKRKGADEVEGGNKQKLKEPFKGMKDPEQEKVEEAGSSIYTHPLLPDKT